jgi:hypothetical protein
MARSSCLDPEHPIANAESYIPNAWQIEIRSSFVSLIAHTEVETDPWLKMHILYSANEYANHRLQATCISHPQTSLPPIRCTPKVHAYDMHAYEMHAYMVRP